MKNRKPIWERLDLLDEPVPGQSLLELCGDQRVILENYSKILEYGTKKIRVRVKFGSICLEGSCLMLRKMCGQQLVITGSIHSICLERG